MENRESAAKRGYDSRWRKAREGWLREHPLCEMHSAMGQVVAATVVDHKVPHRGDKALFWDRDNWESLCKQCHDRHKQRVEKGGGVVGCDVAGTPLDASHHWNR